MPLEEMPSVSPQFVHAVEWAMTQARQSQDETVRFMVSYIPIYAQYRPTRAQAVAGGCPTCTYLGLWADAWPGYEPAKHGLIFLFEEGIRSMGGALREQVYATLIHEMDHALQRDHILHGVMEAKAAAMYRPYAPYVGCCGR